MKKVFNITYVKNNFLNIINNISYDIIITKNYLPVAEIKGFNKSIKTFKKISLIVLGSKKCSINTAYNSIKVYNKISDKFDNIIFVYSDDTDNYIKKFNSDNLILSFNEKTEYPIITALKKGISGLVDNEKYFMVTFLNKNINEKVYLKLITAIKNNLKKNIFIPIINNKPKHPIIFSDKYITKIIHTRKELGIPYILNKFKKDISFVEVN